MEPTACERIRCPRRFWPEVHCRACHWTFADLLALAAHQGQDGCAHPAGIEALEPVTIGHRSLVLWRLRRAASQPPGQSR